MTRQDERGYTAGWRSFHEGEINESDDDSQGSDADVTIRTQEAQRLLSEKAKMMASVDFDGSLKFLEAVAEGQTASDDEYNPYFIQAKSRLEDESTDDEQEEVFTVKEVEALMAALTPEGAGIDDEEGDQDATLKAQLKAFKFTEADVDRRVKEDRSEFLEALMVISRKLETVESTIGPLVDVVRQDDLCSPAALKFLQAKTHLLLSYLQYLLYYYFLRVRGETVKDHPVVDRLMECRSLLEKSRALDEKYAYTVKKALNSIDATTIETLRPRPSALVDDDDREVQIESDQEDEDMEAGAYLAPKTNPVEFTSKHESLISKAEKIAERERRRVSNKELVRELRRDLDDAPEEVAFDDTIRKDRIASDLLAKHLSREDEEEEAMRRVKLSKKAKKELRYLQKQESYRPYGDLEDLEMLADQAVEGDDGLQMMLGGAGRKNTSLNRYLKTAESAKAAMGKIQSSDSRVEARTIKKEPRRKSEPVLEESLVDDIAVSYEPSEKKTARMNRRKQKLLLNMPAPEPEADGRRSAIGQVTRNKGLTKKRASTSGTARVAYRDRHFKKMKTLTGTRRVHRDGDASGNYHGESTISTKVVRSRKLH
ncbi:MAG: uncharacterized protein KVP18_000712 [Porospora cf. gigantea A]|uniref:uncharacterized protein n=1 Tax=Porospora cf. gigantea A TaxID=2853593 RepID=UPI00355ABE55|nr:MAG: hypothetical protein KVP18_000712 [Porospora cf. gigantea A]